MFDDDASVNDNQENEKDSSPWPILLILGILFLPALIVAVIMRFALLRYGRQKLSVSMLVTGALVVIGIAYGASSNAIENIGFVVQNITDIQNNWSMIIPALISLNLILGAIAGVGYITIEIRRMKSNPHMTQLEGSWMYKFEFRRSPLELLKYRKTIAGLKSGSYADDKKAPLGIIEDDDDSVVYRYNSEALKQTLISGAAGSGKALPLDSEVATPEGFRKLSELNVGDNVFAPNGDITEIVSFSDVTKEEEYKIEFNDGSSMVTSGDHRFVVYTSRTRNAIVRQDKKILDSRIDLSEKAIKNIKEDLALSQDGDFITIPELSAVMEKPSTASIRSLVKRFGASHEIDKVLAYPRRPILEALLKINEGFTPSVFPERMTVKDMMNVPIKAGSGWNLSVKSSSAVEYPENDNLPVHPYILGVWLGDGQTSSTVHEKASYWSIEDTEILDRIVELDPGVTYEKYDDRKNYRVSGLGKELFSTAVIEDKSWNHVGLRKTIPREFLQSSYKQRLELLKGLMDTDGSVDNDGGAVFCQSEENLARQVAELVTSLGWIAKVRERKTSYKETSRNVFYVSFDPSVDVFTLERKNKKLKINQDRQNKRQWAFKDHRKIVKISKTGRSVPMRCMSVKSDTHQFLVGRNYLPTSNTITLLSLVLNDIKNGIPVILIDFKKDMDLSSKIATWSHEYGREFYHFVNGDPEDYDIPHSKGQAKYDPLINGGSAKSDMVLGMREYDTAAEVYKSGMRQLLQVLFAMLKQADKSKAENIDWWHGGISQIASAMSGNNFTELVSACEGRPIQNDAEALDMQARSKTSNIKRAFEELAGQMRTIVASDYGRWLRTDKNSRNIDLYNLTKTPGEGSVILFSLNADSEKDFSKYLGSLIFSDLNAVSALRRNNGLKNDLHVYVDEFQAVPPTAVNGLLEKSRGSALGMTLSSQSYEQIISSSDKNGEAYLLGILDTCSNFIVHAGMTEDSAIRLSKIIGKDFVPVYKQTNANHSFAFSLNFNNRRKSMVQTSEEERWIVPPNGFMSLSSPVESNGYKSTAVVINKTPDDPKFKKKKGALARTVWMIPDNKVVDRYYSPKTSSDSYESDREYVDEDVFEYQAAPLVDGHNDNQNSYDDAFSNDGNIYETSHEDEVFVDEVEDGEFTWEEVEGDDPVESYPSARPEPVVRESLPSARSFENDSSSRPRGGSGSSGLPIGNSSSQSRNNGRSGLPVTAAVHTSSTKQNENKPHARRSALETSDFSNMFNADIKPQTLKGAKNQTAPTETLDDDSDALPSLDDLF